MVHRIDKVERSEDFLRWCQERGYRPIDSNYRFATTNLRYVCSCGQIRAISWKRFKRGETGCRPCSKARGAAKRAYTVEQAREKFLAKRLQLISDKYVNANTHLEYVCLVCHVGGRMRLSTVNLGHGCKTCAYRIKAAARRTSIAAASEFFEANDFLCLKASTSTIRHPCNMNARIVVT